MEALASSSVLSLSFPIAVTMHQWQELVVSSRWPGLLRGFPAATPVSYPLPAFSPAASPPRASSPQ
eukprot:12929667-Prorocentrum_lima.AAC.1